MSIWWFCNFYRSSLSNYVCIFLQKKKHFPHISKKIVITKAHFRMNTFEIVLLLFVYLRSNTFLSVCVCVCFWWSQWATILPVVTSISLKWMNLLEFNGIFALEQYEWIVLTDFCSISFSVNRLYTTKRKNKLNLTDMTLPIEFR